MSKKVVLIKGITGKDSSYLTEFLFIKGLNSNKKVDLSLLSQ